MKIVHVCSELAPCAKVGGLADVVSGLSKQMAERGHDVQIIMPHYGCVDTQGLERIGEIDHFSTVLSGQEHACCALRFSVCDGVELLLLDTISGYWRSLESIYGSDVERFLFFSRAAADWIQARELPDIIHVHDWPTAILPAICPGNFVLTMHNFEFQGWCQWSDIEQIGVCRQPSLEKIFADPHGDCLNLVKAGLLKAQQVTTVSTTYAKELSDPLYGRGLEGVIGQIKGKFSGIVNGIDCAYWDPERDGFLHENYAYSQPLSKVIEAKRLNKKHLLEQLGISFSEKRPLASFIARLVPQKGPLLVHDLCQSVQDIDFQCVVLGSVATPELQEAFEQLDIELRRSDKGAVVLSYDEGLSHRLFAGSDMFFVPSLFEPCGLTQRIAMRYGTIPIVRRTGGLADTVTDGENGFVFHEPSLSAFKESFSRACAVYNTPEAWERFVCCAMREDVSWNIPGGEYLDLYERLISA